MVEVKYLCYVRNSLRTELQNHPADAEIIMNGKYIIYFQSYWANAF